MIKLGFDKTFTLVALGLMLVGIVGLVGCGYKSSYQVSTPENKASSGSPAAASQAASPDISISGFAFLPANVTVLAGTTVTWRNKDSVSHTVTDDAFKSSNLSRDGAFSFTFNQPGAFEYRCAYHPYMTGKVIVTQ